MVGHFLLFLDARVRKLGNIDHHVFALGQEFVEWRIKRADDDREAIHGFEEAGEIFALHRQQLWQRFFAGLFVTRQNHSLHVRQAIFGEEHVFRAAETDTFGTECAGGLGVARNVGIGADAKLAAELISPFHEGGEVVRFRIGLARLALAQINFAQRAI